MNTGEWIRLERKGEIGTILLDRPETLNILDAVSLERIGALLGNIERDGGIRAVIITGTGHFCAGADIKELRKKDRDTAEAFARLGHTVCGRIEDMDRPVIAAMRGYALGAGCEIALACDIRIASEGARMGQPEVNLGLVPGFGGTQRLARLVGIGRAKEMVLTGANIGAQEAGKIGLVNRVVKEDELVQKAEELALVLAKKSPVTMRMAKMLINENYEIRKGLEKEVASFAECFATEDHMEGISAFLEKREPRFKGR